MAKEYKLSAERLKELQDELTYLKTVREKEVADQIKEARSFGDLSGDRGGRERPQRRPSGLQDHRAGPGV